VCYIIAWMVVWSVVNERLSCFSLEFTGLAQSSQVSPEF
jgi:hypothetical protein